MVRLGASLFWLFLVGPSHALSIKLTFAQGLRYEQNASQFVKSQAKRLELVGCWADNIALEVVIIVGHADASERHAQTLSLARAERVRADLLQRGLPPGRVYVDGEGSRYPLDAEAGAPRRPALNRRVQIEVVGTPAIGKDPRSCVPTWEKQVLGLTDAQGLTVGRALIREQVIDADELALTVAKAGRTDLLAKVIEPSGRLHLAPQTRVDLVREAVRQGDDAMLSLLIRHGIRVIEMPTAARPLIWAVCDTRLSNVTVERRLAVVSSLLGWGAKPVLDSNQNFTQTALECAARQGDLPMVDVLLSAGADPSLPPQAPALVMAGPYPEVARRLIAFGASPLIRSGDGETLAHRFKWQSPDDVTWLVGLGLSMQDASRDGATPLENALSFASPIVLDAMLAAGASLGDPGRAQRLVNSAWNNPQGLVWLVAHGLAVDEIPDFLTQQAGKGDSFVKVVAEVFKRQDVPATVADMAMANALAAAIRIHAPETVQLLADHGATRKFSALPVTGGLSPLAYAKKVPMAVILNPYANPEAYERANSPEMLAQRRARNAEVIRILSQVGGAQ